LDVAREIYEEMEFFAQYGFNKSHSAAYALLSIQTAWLKANHPAEFMAATMSTEMRKSDRITQLIDEVKALNITIRPPDINQPRAEFGVHNGEIIFGMAAVKGVGAAAIDIIRDCHNDLGRDFTDLFDMCENVDLQKVNRKVLEGLINSGAMDLLPGHRHQLLMNLDKAIGFGQNAARDRISGQRDMFGGTSVAESLKPTMSDCEKFDPLVEWSKERAAVGFFLSGHPFEEYHELIESLPTSACAAAHGRGEGTWVDLVGVITSHTKHRDKHKRVYARANFEDQTGVVPLTIYSRQYEKVVELVESDSILVVGGRVQVRSDEAREIVVDRIIRIDEVLGTWVKDIFLHVDLEHAGRAGMEELGTLFDTYGGSCEMRPLKLEEEDEAKAEPVVKMPVVSMQGTMLGGGGGATAAAATPVVEAPKATGDPDGMEFGGAPMGADPDMMAVEILAKPVPLVVEVERDGKKWLLKSEGRNIALTLESLRRLRQVAGTSEMRLRAVLPAAPVQKKRFFGRG